MIVFSSDSDRDCFITVYSDDPRRKVIDKIRLVPATAATLLSRIEAAEGDVIDICGWNATRPRAELIAERIEDWLISRERLNG